MSVAIHINMELAFFVFLNFLHFGICGFINEGFAQYGVELSVFSGRSSPSWTVDRNNPLYPRIAARINRARSTRMSEKLGYSGFVVEMKNPFGQRVFKTVGAGTNPRLELLLLNSSPYPIERSVRRHVIDTVRRSVMYRRKSI
ncbi:uncharacterized protein LOC123539710 [Mercenaria mercenaria]|uniref:uncharacterized protein LOC123539710 n=1 Tax=Mercenaria mercenaria TaxID=6596 RepID=UPI00234FAAB3|nr:uncharacterized protein LOC123539710 [Mercenaria mercenaria]